MFATANTYHLVHSLAIALAPAIVSRPHLARGARRCVIPRARTTDDATCTLLDVRLSTHAQVGSLFTGGTALFCGSLYHLGGTETRGSRMRKLGPVGASLLYAGWLGLALR